MGYKPHLFLTDWVDSLASGGAQSVRSRKDPEARHGHGQNTDTAASPDGRTRHEMQPRTDFAGGGHSVSRLSSGVRKPQQRLGASPLLPSSSPVKALTCGKCGRRPAEQGDPVPTDTTAYTCSPCLVNGGSRKPPAPPDGAPPASVQPGDSRIATPLGVPRDFTTSFRTHLNRDRWMPDRPWKQEERRAAALFGGRRLAAVPGRTLDFESDAHVGRVRHVQRLSLAQLEALAEETERLGENVSKTGVVVIKRRAEAGRQTPRLVVMTEMAWRRIAAGDGGGPAMPDVSPQTDIGTAEANLPPMKRPTPAIVRETIRVLRLAGTTVRAPVLVRALRDRTGCSRASVY
jgi:hypothetical protein